jgi:hypothetical protein
MTDSQGGNANPPRDALLRHIDDYLRTYWMKTDTWERVSILGELYFLTDCWLKTVQHGQSHAGASLRSPAAPSGWLKTVQQGPRHAIFSARQPVVLKLFRSVVDALCFLLDCKVNYLPQRIEETWGRMLTPHGYNLDNLLTTPGAIPTTTEYLSSTEREKYRLAFRDGKAFQKTWWDPPIRWVPADSARVHWHYGPKVPDTTPPMFDRGFAGFALSMGREFYMATHYGGFEDPRARLNFYHSAYLSGDAVLCTGSMLIDNGEVKAIKNDSGHYKPRLEHLVNIVQALGMYGIAPYKVKVFAVAHSWQEDDGSDGPYEFEIAGDQLLRWRSGALGTRLRAEANERNMRACGRDAYLRKLP